jgi:16S rRNA G966 N2-methylase RsmD
VLAREVTTGIKILEDQGESFQIIFLDPPYGQGFVPKTLEALAASSIVSPHTLIVAEHAVTDPAFSIPHLERVDVRKYGGTLVSFFRMQEGATEFNPKVIKRSAL